MKNMFLRGAIVSILYFSFIFSSPVFADQSKVISEFITSEGIYYYGERESEEDAKNFALEKAKKRAQDQAGITIESRITTEFKELKENIVKAYANSTVKVVGDVDSQCDRNEKGNFCKVRIKAEVIPNNTELSSVLNNKPFMDDPFAPLNVDLRMKNKGKNEFKNGERIEIAIRGNKDFYLMLTSVDQDGKTFMLIPNAWNENNFFTGGQWHKIPKDDLEFVLVVDCTTGTCGKESITALASSHPINIETSKNKNLTQSGNVYEIKIPQEVHTRSVKAAIAEQADKNQNYKMNAPPSTGVTQNHVECTEQTIVFYTKK